MADHDPIAMVTPEGDEFLAPGRCPVCWAGLGTPEFEREIGAIQEQLTGLHRDIEKAEARHLAWREQHPEVT